jgi:hypothetical protein
VDVNRALVVAMVDVQLRHVWKPLYLKADLKEEGGGIVIESAIEIVADSRCPTVDTVLISDADLHHAPTSFGIHRHGVLKAEIPHKGGAMSGQPG